MLRNSFSGTWIEKTFNKFLWQSICRHCRCIRNAVHLIERRTQKRMSSRPAEKSVHKSESNHFSNTSSTAASSPKCNLIVRSFDIPVRWVLERPVTERAKTWPKNGKAENRFLQRECLSKAIFGSSVIQNDSRVMNGLERKCFRVLNGILIT